MGRIILAFLIVSVTAIANDDSTGAGTYWSKEARVLNYVSGVRHIEIPSPDRRKIAIVDEFGLKVKADDKFLTGLVEVGINSLSELGWSGDSRAFFINQSLGGSVGEWVTTVFYIKNDSVLSIDVAKNPVHQFEKYYECFEPQEPNVGAVAWIDDSEELLIVTEVPPHSNCKEMGKIRGYVVSISSGEIVSEFDEVTLRTNWRNYLGERILLCDWGNELVVLKIDDINRRLFIKSDEMEILDSKEVVSIIASIAQYVKNCKVWSDDWCVSLFADKRYASYKDDESNLQYLKDGSWSRNYLAEFENKSKTLIRYPAIPEKRSVEKLSQVQ